MQNASFEVIKYLVSRHTKVNDTFSYEMTRIANGHQYLTVGAE